MPQKKDLAGLLDVKKTLKIEEPSSSQINLDRNYLVNRMIKTTNK